MTNSWSLLCKKNYTTTLKKRLTKVERSKINIDIPLNEIIIGLLLGDGHLQCRNGNSRFIYGQSSLREHHLNYFYHIFDLFKSFIYIQSVLYIYFAIYSMIEFSKTPVFGNRINVFCSSKIFDFVSIFRMIIKERKCGSCSVNTYCSLIHKSVEGKTHSLFFLFI